MNSPLHRMAVYICTLSVGWYTACCFLLQEQKRYYLWLRNLVKFGSWTFWLLLVRETGSWRSFLSLQLKMGGWETAKWQSSLCYVSWQISKLPIWKTQQGNLLPVHAMCQRVPRAPGVMEPWLCEESGGSFFTDHQYTAQCTVTLLGTDDITSIHGTVHISVTTGDITWVSWIWFWLEINLGAGTVGYLFATRSQRKGLFTQIGLLNGKGWNLFHMRAHGKLNRDLGYREGDVCSAQI